LSLKQGDFDTDFSLQSPIAAYSNVFAKSANEAVTVPPTLLINMVVAVTVTSLWPQRKTPLWTFTSEPTRVTRSISLLRFVRSSNYSSQRAQMRPPQMLYAAHAT